MGEQKSFGIIHPTKLCDLFSALEKIRENTHASSVTNLSKTETKSEREVAVTRYYVGVTQSI